MHVTAAPPVVHRIADRDVRRTRSSGGRAPQAVRPRCTCGSRSTSTPDRRGAAGPPPARAACASRRPNRAVA